MLLALPEKKTSMGAMKAQENEFKVRNKVKTTLAKNLAVLPVEWMDEGWNTRFAQAAEELMLQRFRGLFFFACTTGFNSVATIVAIFARAGTKVARPLYTSEGSKDWLKCAK